LNPVPLHMLPSDVCSQYAHACNLHSKVGVADEPVGAESAVSQRHWLGADALISWSLLPSCLLRCSRMQPFRAAGSAQLWHDCMTSIKEHARTSHRQRRRATHSTVLAASLLQAPLMRAGSSTTTTACSSRSRATSLRKLATPRMTAPAAPPSTGAPVPSCPARALGRSCTAGCSKVLRRLSAHDHQHRCLLELRARQCHQSREASVASAGCAAPIDALLVIRCA
jgi:hypothetical protein